MAEVLGVVASGVAVLQLASQILSVSKKLHGVCSGVKGVPKRISDLLEEIQILAETLEQTPLSESDAAQKCQFFLKKTMIELEIFLKELEVKLNGCGGKTKRVLGRIKAVMKDQEVDRLVARLERTKNTFEIDTRACLM
jgi:uncharacterized protein YoxC